MKHRLTRLLNPRSVAVIGGGTWCENTIQQMRQFGYDGDIWPVHPNRTQMADIPCFASIHDLPTPPDASFIGINRHATIQTVAALSHRGAGGAICFASGFLEAHNEDKSGAHLQADLIHAAGDMPILGPNCYGFINYLDGAILWPDQQGGARVQSGVAIITQSSNIAINITMQRRGLPIGMLITAGNQAQTGLAELGSAVLSDPRITALGLHIEGIRDIRALETLAATARALGKSIIALRVGRSDQSRAATLSHTASLAGSDAGGRALLNRLGIAQADTLPTFLEALKLLHVNGPLDSNRVMSLSCSGGEASLMADLAAVCGVVFPPLSPGQKTALRDALGPMVYLANPLDYHTYIWGDVAAMARTFRAAISGEAALTTIVADFPRTDRCTDSDWDCVIDAATTAQTATGHPVAIVASLPENMPEHVAQSLIKAGITPLAGLQEALQAVSISAQCILHDIPRPILLPQPPRAPEMISEAQAKITLSAHGLDVPRSRAVETKAELPEATIDLQYPLVLKGNGHAHKTEVGAVTLNLRNLEQVQIAAQNMASNGYLLEEMITGVVAELLIGVVLDPAHGYVLTIGAGGTLAEILQDSVSVLIPTSRDELITAISGLKINIILRGHRGKAAANIPSIIDAVMSIQNYVIANRGHVAEVEINPLLCLPNRAIAADALIRTGDIDD